MTVLAIDLETRSAVDLRKAGVHRYAEDPTTDVWCACYAFDDGPVQVWRPGEPCPKPIVRHKGTISAWNAHFERIIWRDLLGPRYGWPVPVLEQFDDTAAWAAAMSLPRALGDAAKAMGLDEQKDQKGHSLMLRMSKPRKPRKGEKAEGLLWWDDEDRIERLIDYCKRDVEAERALRRVLVPLSEAERRVWLFDAKMNDRGIPIDLFLVRALRRISDDAAARLDEELREATGGEVTACSQVGRLTAWLQRAGVPATSLAKAALEDLLGLDDLPANARRAIEIRKQAAKTSTKKLDAMLACVSSDGRARGQHLYHGAGTGRWSGKLIQVQNMPRGTGTVKDPEGAADLFLTGSVDLVETVFGNPMSATSDMLRACFAAPRLLAADFSSIEGRVTAWLAGEEWKLAAFHAADAGEGPGIYELTASGIFDVPIDKVSKAERQVGKVAELALGYQGGVMAFDSMARLYGVDMSTAYAPLHLTTDAKTWAKAEKRYGVCLKSGTTGADVLTREQWIASEVTKLRWREQHPATVALWEGLEVAAFDAVTRPGTVSTYNGIRYVMRRGFLWCQLPSGRCLAYGAPRISERVWVEWLDSGLRETMAPNEAYKAERLGEVKLGGPARGAISALGVDSTTKQWARFGLYGGLATENCVQAIARDLMAEGMLAAEDAGYPIIMTVHDEAVAEVPDGFGSVEDFENVLCTRGAWASTIPVVATGYEAKRYRKD